MIKEKKSQRKGNVAQGSLFLSYDLLTIICSRLFRINRKRLKIKDELKRILKNWQL